MGLFMMAMGDKIDKKYANYLMRARVAMQLLTVVALLLYFTASK